MGDDVRDDASDIVAEYEADDILMLATLIGIGPDEVEYLWIAKEAYQSDLPGGWDIYFDEDGKHFYYNNDTNTSTYEHPSIEFYRKLYEDFKEKDEEFRKRQEERELALGQVAEEEERPETTGPESRPTTADIEALNNRANTTGDELNNKSRLLQTFSQDPTIASKLRKDIIEQDEKATEVLKLGLRKEESDFSRRLERFVKLRESTATKPIEHVLETFAQNNEAKLDEALAQLKEEMKVMRESAGKDSNEEILKAIKSVQMAAAQPSAADTARRQRADKLASTSPTRKEACEKCKESGEKIAELEKQVKELEAKVKAAPAAAAAAAEGGGGGERGGKADKVAVQAAVKEAEEAAMARYEELEAKYTEGQEQMRALRAENVKLKKAAKAIGAGVEDAEQVRQEMEKLSLEASMMDMTQPDLAPSSPGGGRARAAPSTENVLDLEDGEEGEGLQFEAGETIDGLLDEFGLTETQLMDIMEKVEGMQGGTSGPIAILRDQIGELESRLRESEEEAKRAATYAAEVTALNQAHVQSLAKIEGLDKELQQAKDHSEHMEFLSQQYADQVNAMHVTLRELRDDLAAEHRSKEERREEEARQAAGANRKEMLSTTSGTSSRVASAAHSRLSGNTNNVRPNTRGSNVPGSAPFVVRVRGSTLLDVKQAASTLKNSLNLLKIDFQAYAEGIFLPLARQLQQNTLVLASSLSAKARDLRLSHQALDASLAGQRILEDKLHVVYAVNFHSFVYLRPLREGETTGFRGPAPRQLTLALNDGFENRSNILETYEFEKVFGPEIGDGMWHEVVPHVSRLLNWQSALVIVRGGRNSGKMDIAMPSTGDKGLFRQAIEYLGLVYQNERDKLAKERRLEGYDLEFKVELTHVVEEEATHLVSSMSGGHGKDGDEDDGGKGGGLLDMRGLLGKIKSVDKEAIARANEEVESDDDSDKGQGKKAGDGGEGGAEALAEIKAEEEELEEEEEEEEEGVMGMKERVPFLPTRGCSTAAEALALVEDAYVRSHGVMSIKQQQHNKTTSEAVQRAKRLAKEGHRNELGELVAEPHYLLSLMITKRDRSTDETQTALFKLCIIGSGAEVEDEANPDPKSGVKFKVVKNTSSINVEEFIDKVYIRESNIDMSLPPSCLSELIYDVAGADSAIVLINAISPSKVDFLETVAEVRWACKSLKVRPTTASRLEKVKYRWKNQASVWAFTLWKAAVSAGVQQQQANAIHNLTEELTFQKSEVSRLEATLRNMAEQGVAYVSGGEEQASSDDGGDDAEDMLMQQKRALEKIIGKDVLQAKQREEGAILAAVTAKLRYAQSQLSNAESNNRSLSKALRAERDRARPLAASAKRTTKKSSKSGGGGTMPELQASHRSSMSVSSMQGNGKNNSSSMGLSSSSLRTSFPHNASSRPSSAAEILPAFSSVRSSQELASSGGAAPFKASRLPRAGGPHNLGSMPPATKKQAMAWS